MNNQNMEENYDPEQDINGLNDIENNNNINYNNNEEEEINDLNDINDENYGDNNYEFDENNINMNLPPQLQMNQKYTNNVLQDLKNTNAQTQKFIKGPLLNNNINIKNNNLNIPYMNNNEINTGDINDYDIMVPNKNNFDKYNKYSNINQINDNLYENNQINQFNQMPKMNIDNISLLKIQNQVLTKSNLDLKNYNKCLKAELNSYKKMTLGNLNFGDSPYSKNDFNLNNYIQTLKTSLNSSQESNIELQNLLKNVQEQKKFLEQQYDNLNQNIEECNLIINGGDGLSQPKIEINNDYIEKCKILEAENETIKQEIENLNNEFK